MDRLKAAHESISGTKELMIRPASTMNFNQKHESISNSAISNLPVSVIALSTATGVLVVAAAYTGGRLGYANAPWADRLYWLGQALIVIPVAIRLLVWRPLTEAGTAALIVVLTIAEYLVKVCYSPVAFTYSDELDHWRSAVDILRTGRLFAVNYQLPISPHYPGLEEVTSALVSISGLPVFISGLIVAGTAHLVCVSLLYLLFRHVGGSHRVAGIAVLIYTSNPDFSFDEMFSYQTLAVAFLGLALLATWRLAAAETGGERGSWLTVAVLAIAATVVTHHVTSYMLVATLMLITAVSLLAGDRRSAGWSGMLALLSMVAIACWVILVAPETVNYLLPVADRVLQSVRDLLTGKHPSPSGRPSSAPAVSTGPLGNRALGAADVLTISTFLLLGAWQVWRRHRRQPWVVAMAIGSFSWYLLVAIRLTVADGSELAGRASTFVFVPLAFILALSVPYVGKRDVPHVGRREPWHGYAVTACSLVAALIFLFDGLGNSWPPYWERLPGAYQAAGFERSVGPQGIDAARWALLTLGPGNRFAADFGNSPILGSYGDQNTALGIGFLYTSPVYTKSDARQVQAQSIHYLLVDRRLSQLLPASGQYFPMDPNAGHYTRPLTFADLNKFDHIRGVSHLYDSGNIGIYDLEGSEYNAP
jgi:hypothetical protein